MGREGRGDTPRNKSRGPGQGGRTVGERRGGDERGRQAGEAGRHATHATRAQPRLKEVGRGGAGGGELGKRCRSCRSLCPPSSAITCALEGGFQGIFKDAGLLISPSAKEAVRRLLAVMR